MGLFKSWAKLVAYPLTRPAQEIKRSVGQVADTVREARDLHQQKVEEAEGIANLLNEKSPQAKFEQMYAALGWTERELGQQLLAAGRTRLAMLFTGLVGFVGLLVLMWFIPRWLILILGPMAVIVLAGCVALGIRYAWWEMQIQTRSLTSFRLFLARPDLFRRLFAGTTQR